MLDHMTEDLLFYVSTLIVRLQFSLDITIARWIDFTTLTKPILMFGWGVGGDLARCGLNYGRPDY